MMTRGGQIQKASECETSLPVVGCGMGMKARVPGIFIAQRADFLIIRRAISEEFGCVERIALNLTTGWVSLPNQRPTDPTQRCKGKFSPNSRV